MRKREAAASEMVLELLELAMELGLLACPGAFRLEPMLGVARDLLKRRWPRWVGGCRGGSGGCGGVNAGLSLGRPKMTGSMDKTRSDETLVACLTERQNDSFFCSGR